jgi:DNA-binding NtrC family response regulator
MSDLNRDLRPSGARPPFPARTATVTPIAAARSAQDDLIRAGFDGASDALERLRHRLTQALGAELVLVYGELGTGKRRVAEVLHRAGRRAGKRLELVDAATEGAMDRVTTLTEAFRQDGDAPGTVVISHLEAAPNPLVPALVALQTALAGKATMIILSSSDFGSLRARSLQHSQLLGRTGAATVLVPPLRARAQDIASLGRAFCLDAATRTGKKLRGISPKAIAWLERRDFSRNMLELRELIEDAVARCNGDWITTETFGALEAGPEQEESVDLVVRLPGTSLREIEVKALEMAMRVSGGRVVRAAEMLGITRHALRRKLEKFGLEHLRRDVDAGDGDATTA